MARSIAVLTFLGSCSGLLGMAAASVQAQTGPGRPTIRLATPFAGPVWRIDVDAAENFAVGSNAAKAATIWPLADARAALTARLPLQDQERKRAHAVAISANAELVAMSVPPRVDAAGRSVVASGAVYVIRRATGRVVYVLDGTGSDIATRPQSLAFSSDGAHLAAVLSSGCGVRVWSMRTAKLVLRDDVGYGGEPGIDRCCRSGEDRCNALPDTTGVKFMPSSAERNYLVTSGDSGVRAYRRSGEQIVLSAHAAPASIDLERPAGIAVSPDGQRLLVGDRRDNALPPPLRLRLAVLDSTTLQPVRQNLEVSASALTSNAFLQSGPEVADMAQTSLERVAWLSARGEQTLVGAGAFPCEIVRPELVVAPPGTQLRGAMCLVRWSWRDPDALPRFVPVGSERVMDVAALPKRGGMLILSQQRIAAIDADGKPLTVADRPVLDLHNTAIDLRGSSGRFRISSDGRTVAMDDYRVLAGGQGTVTFEIDGLRTTADSSRAASLDPDQGEGAVPPIVDGWRNVQGRSPLIAGRPLPAAEVGRNEIFRSVAVLRQRKSLVIGSSEQLRLVDYSGAGPRVLCREPITEDVYRVNITPDGNLIISGHADGTVRWWRVHDRGGGGCQLQRLLTAHIGEATPGRWTWAAWRPNGLYARDMASGLKLEWQRTLPDGQVGTTEFHRLLLFIDRDAIRKALDPVVIAPSPDEVIASQTPEEDLIVLAERPVPVVELASEPALRTARTTLALRLAAEKGWPKRITARLSDDTHLTLVYKGRAAPVGESIFIDAADAADGKLVEIDVDLPPKARMRTGADVQICFFIGDDPQPDGCHPLKWMGDPAPPPPRRLWALFVAVSKAAPGSGLDLRFPENDAIDLARLFIDDFERRAVERRSPVPPDFTRVELHLAVSATAGAEAELGELARRSWVKRLRADKADIAEALQQIAQAMNEVARTEPGDDLFLMTYSGHGIVDPNRPGGSAFLVAEATLPIVTERDLKIAGARAMSSAELLHLLRQIPTRKVIIVDACRSLARMRVARPFSPELMRTEFERGSLDTHFFFSSDVGQEAFELEKEAFDKSRPKDRQGNGLFTYGLLTGLTRPRSDQISPAAARRIDIPWLAHYLQNVFFDNERPDSPAMQLKAADPQNIDYLPTPRYIPARSDHGSQIMRTLEGN